MTRTITIVLYGEDIPDDQYNDLTLTSWMITQAMARAVGLTFEVRHDGGNDRSRRMNALWDTYGRETRWI